MPLFLEPDQKFAVVLDSDMSKPETSRPTFWARSQSMRGQAKIAKVLDRLTEDKTVTADQLFADAVECLSQVLIGWSNMGEHKFSIDALQNLTYGEARELLRKVAYNQHMSADEKKDSESLPPSLAGNSVVNAATSVAA